MSLSNLKNVLAAGKVASLESEDILSLRDVLRFVPDPRKRRGIRYPFADLLLICAAAVVSGATTFAVIHEWARHAAGMLSQQQVSVPSLSTIQ